ncbi:hypothetical protein J8273_5005 [Carpediemonas membranifera]|uniref:Uncharacterized protein n=1 Tax=Carpediemonas membranifera TaxID=201153 RepID=A0A8J6E1I4_9EUKA|nr:hypothetical protein J8273_5005 [Carpediemonas membranifera]|eukprot:KAG9393518.1 hypothetical protein J8273_5005 [Carpediemonas membranifera]
MLDLFTWLEEATEFEKKELMTKINAAASAKGKCDVLRALLLPRRDLLATVIKERTLLSEIVYTGVNLKRIATFFRLTRQETEDMKKDLKAQFMATMKLNEGERVTGEHKKTLKQVLGGDTFTHLYDGEVESARIRVKKSIREARMKTNARLECELAKEEDEDIRDCTRVQMMKLADEEDRKELEKEMEYTRESKYDVVWERVYDEICGTRRVRARRDNAPCPGEDHADHVLQRYLWADQIDTQALTGEKTLTTRLPAEARVVRRVTASLISAQKTEIQSLKEQVERLKKQVTDERRDHFLECRRIHHEHDVGYLASCDVSFAASPMPPQSGTLSRTSCPRRATNEPEASMSVKRKALFITPEKARPEDSEEETEEEQEEAKEKRGEAEEETVNTCDACIQTEPETQTRITSEAAVQTCINAEALTAGCTAIHVKSDGNCVAYCLQAIELGGRVDGDFEKWQRGLCQSVKAKYWSKKNVTERSLRDPDSGYYNSNAIRVWARKQKRNILVVQSYDGYNGMQGISAILYLFDGTTILAPDADLWGLTDNFAIVIEGDPAHATLYQKKCEVVEIE